MNKFNCDKKLLKLYYVTISKNELKNIEFKINNLIIIIKIIYIFFFGFYLINKINKKCIIKNNYILSKKSLITKNINNEFISKIKSILNDNEIIENEIMKKHTTFKIGGPAKYFIIPKTINQIIEIIKLCNQYNVYFFILGNGSNLLVSDEGYYGIVILIHEINFSQFRVTKEDEINYTLIVGGGMLMKTLSIEACLLSLTGLEDIVDIPGTLGGGIIMNASFRKTGLEKPLKKVKVITPEGKLLELSKEECGLIHRGSMLKNKKYIVIEATFKLNKGDQMLIQKTMTNNTKMRYDKQPMYFGSAGCFFVWDHHRHGSMYKKYKQNNLISYRVGNAMIYTYNIAFIVNLGNGTASEVMTIVTNVEKLMKKKYKIEIKREVVVIGVFNNTEYY